MPGTENNAPPHDIAELIETIVGVFGSETKAVSWMNTPNISLGGCTPNQVLDLGICRDLIANALDEWQLGARILRF